MRHLEIARPAGRVHLERLHAGWSIDLDLDGPAPSDAATDLLRTALAEVASRGGGIARHRVRADDPATRAASEALGLIQERSLHQLRRPLPVDQPWTLDVRPFVVGQDEEAWLAVNNRAFAWHPEQSGWTVKDLQARIAEPWFDATGFLLHERAGRLVGFCWTKEHRDTDPALGEIYVIAVDPAAGARGLGRPLTLAGLDHLHGRSIGTGMLYVDGGNTAGLRLYESLGFTVHHTDVSFTVDVAAS